MTKLSDLLREEVSSVLTRLVRRRGRRFTTCDLDLRRLRRLDLRDRFLDLGRRLRLLEYLFLRVRFDRGLEGVLQLHSTLFLVRDRDFFLRGLGLYSVHPDIYLL